MLYIALRGSRPYSNTFVGLTAGFFWLLWIHFLREKELLFSSFCCCFDDGVKKGGEVVMSMVDDCCCIIVAIG